ncbi:unnamed protein product [Bursaphelenchus okinawaensis]|uniref:C2H2-type domain-containing protein n=1 Tax=Bursaphelenchus okinawaensis TaxID=465554 RepID=A0A811JQT9_9BILA|nr:unnamed protein product [Bursaphelenchus okinawaensis]CAG9078822.1 unnamed protein product [Bursaphelenchus okinawaensis]
MTQQPSSSNSQNLNRVKFTQNEEVLFISEPDPLKSPSEPGRIASESIKRIVITTSDQIQEFAVEKNREATNFSILDTQCYCIPCSARFQDQLEFASHCDQVHSVQINDTADLMLMTGDNTVINAYSKPDDSSPSNMTNQFMMNMSQQMLNGELMKFMRAQQFAPNAPFVQRNSSKTLKCPKCNWHYKYQETLEIHMKEKHNDLDVKCIFCLQNQPHPKLARGESYSCGYKPYRCELCKYSTTTKGNLSIHMQSDKHLHAVQEMPNNIAQQTPVNPLELTSDKLFTCLICNNFRTNSNTEILDHLEQDRSGLNVGDISMINGFYHCHLCPYNTNLKANFQLHTKTDKHIQRVQLINHMRECSTPTSPNALLGRLSAAKSTVQVRCGVCQEILVCTSSLREHCDSRLHLHRASILMLHSTSPVRRGSAVISSQNNNGGIQYECVYCGGCYDDQSGATAHLTQCANRNVDELSLGCSRH